MVKVTSTFDLSALQGLKNLAREADVAVRRTAFFIEAEAKLNTPVDTGALRASIYTVTPRQSGYFTAISRGRTLRPMFKNDPEIKTVPELTAYVAVGAEYGKFVEYGAQGRPAQPFMAPAAMRGQGFFTTEMQAAIKRAIRP